MTTEQILTIELLRAWSIIAHERKEKATTAELREWFKGRSEAFEYAAGIFEKTFKGDLE